ncbi:hypothetical protein RN001_015676 [Aquatica leii]|uniref:Dihydropteridine reductase n=1 Tax=Aquatica leii TaxID=1421715 RepID=A0AAN7PNB7_9COLE|nr:hypothetical protein RN001_015676 [Aquatica leii]
MALQRVIVYGGKGALGAKCISQFKEKNWWVGSIDLGSNDEADVNILVESGDNLPEQEEKVLSSISNALGSSKLDAIICVAGGWAGGNAKKDLAKTSDLMWRQSVWSSVIAASIAAQHLNEGGLLALTGANAALQETPGMIGYGMAKAAVHHLTKSLAEDGSGLPTNSTCVAILPVTLDTPMNRKWMPKADFGTWTPLEFVAELFWKWSVDRARPSNGSLIQLITKNSATDVIAV